MNEEASTAIIIVTLFAAVTVCASIVTTCQVRINEQMISLIGKGVPVKEARCVTSVLGISCKIENSE